jgi:hypothetical protein
MTVMQECTASVFHCISEWTLCFELQFSQDPFNTTKLCILLIFTFFYN